MLVEAANVHMEAPRATKIPVTVVMNSDHGRIGGHRVLLIVLVIGMDVLIARAGIWLILMRRRRLMRTAAVAGATRACCSTRRAASHRRRRPMRRLWIRRRSTSPMQQMPRMRRWARIAVVAR